MSPPDGTPATETPAAGTPAGPTAAEATTGASLIRGGGWNVFSRVLPQVYIVVMSVVVARSLGPSDMGRQSFIAFVALSATMVFTGGLSVSLMRHVGEMLGAQRPAALRGLVRWAWRLELLGAAIGGGVLVAVALLGGDPTGAWVLAGVGCSLGIMQAIPSAVLIGAQRWRAASIVGLSTGGLAMVAVIVVLALGGGIVGIFAVEAAVAAINLALTSVLAKRQLATLEPGVEQDRDLRRRTLAYAGWGTLGSILTFVVFRRSEFFFLERFSTDAEIAMYSIAFAATYAVVLVPEALIAVVVPAFATLFGAGDHERMRIGLARGLRLVVLLSIPLAATVLALGPQALLIVYGDEYARVEPVLRVLILGLPLLSLLNVCNAFLVGLGKARPLLLIGAAAAAVNVALALVLVPAWDAVGAALANLLAQATVAVITLTYVLRTVHALELDPRSLAATLAASAGAALPAWLIVEAIGGPGGVVAGLAVGALLFAAFGSLLKLLSGEDAAWLRGATAGGVLEAPVGVVCRLTARRAGG